MAEVVLDEFFNIHERKADFGLSAFLLGIFTSTTLRCSINIYIYTKKKSETKIQTFFFYKKNKKKKKKLLFNKEFNKI
jgi:predicted secreted protein